MFGIIKEDDLPAAVRFLRHWNIDISIKKALTKNQDFGLSPFAKLSLAELPAGIALLRLA